MCCDENFPKGCLSFAQEVQKGGEGLFLSFPVCPLGSLVLASSAFVLVLGLVSLVVVEALSSAHYLRAS